MGNSGDQLHETCVHWTQPGDFGMRFSSAANMLGALGHAFLPASVSSPLIILLFLSSYLLNTKLYVSVMD